MAPPSPRACQSRLSALRLLLLQVFILLRAPVPRGPWAAVSHSLAHAPERCLQPGSLALPSPSPSPRRFSPPGLNVTSARRAHAQTLAFESRLGKRVWQARPCGR